MVWLIDCWSVHTSSTFRLWMKTIYPYILLLYVPTQPADVDLLRPFKCVFAKKIKLWSAHEIQRMVAIKVPVDAMKVDSSMEKVRENVEEWMFMA